MEENNKITQALIEKDRKHDDQLTELFILTAKLQVQVATQQELMVAYQLQMKKLDNDIDKVNRHIAWVEGISKFIGFIIALAGGVAAYLKIFKGGG